MTLAEESKTSENDRFLYGISGVVQIGANLGQERRVYNKHGLSVLRIESIPDIFSRLRLNIAGFSKQRARQHLVTDRDNQEYTFHIANKDGASSSIF